MNAMKKNVLVSLCAIASMSGLLLTGCGNEYSLNSLIVTSSQEEALDVLMSEAERAYNQGDFTTAQEKAEKAYAINNNNEEAAILLGYIYLSLAGIDPFQIAGKLMEGSEKATTAKTTLVASSTNAADQLSTMSSLVGVTSSDLDKLGEKKVSELSAFSDYPIIWPKSAQEARESGVASLTYVNRAIKIICPFVSREVLISDDPDTAADESDPRHTEDACPESQNTKYSQSKAHFLWAFSHITDALTFYSVILYSTAGDGLPNIEKRAKAVNSSQTSNIGTYVQLVAELADDISNVFQTDDRGSQLTAVLNGLTAASKGFATMAGVPDDFTAGIDKALETIKNPVTSGGGSTTVSPSTVLKGQMTENVAKQLNTKISDLKTSDPDAYNAQKDDICNAFDTITGGQSTEKPSDC